MTAELSAIHSRHLDVGDHEIEACLVAQRDAQRAFSICGFDHLVRRLREQTHEHPPDRGLVVDHQNARGPPTRFTGFVRRCRTPGWRQSPERSGSATRDSTARIENSRWRGGWELANYEARRTLSSASRRGQGERHDLVGTSRKAGRLHRQRIPDTGARLDRDRSSGSPFRRPEALFFQSSRPVRVSNARMYASGEAAMKVRPAAVVMAPTEIEHAAHTGRSLHAEALETFHGSERCRPEHPSRFQADADQGAKRRRRTGNVGRAEKGLAFEHVGRAVHARVLRADSLVTILSAAPSLECRTGYQRDHRRDSVGGYHDDLPGRVIGNAAPVRAADVRRQDQRAPRSAG